MTVSSKIRKIGNSSAVILPNEIISSLQLERGDTVNLTQTSEGILISPYDVKAARLKLLA